MTTRTRRETVTFRHPFHIHGIDRLLPAGSYQVIADEETIRAETVSAWRRVGTSIIVPKEDVVQGVVEGAIAGVLGSEQMLSIRAVDLADACRIDASVAHD